MTRPLPGVLPPGPSLGALAQTPIIGPRFPARNRCLFDPHFSLPSAAPGRQIAFGGISLRVAYSLHGDNLRRYIINTPTLNNWRCLIPCIPLPRWRRLRPGGDGLYLLVRRDVRNSELLWKQTQLHTLSNTARTPARRKQTDRTDYNTSRRS